MAVHWKDIERQAIPIRLPGKPWRLFGIGADGIPYFYWSETKGEYSAYCGENAPRTKWVWGTLGCGSGKRMKDEKRVFLADLATVRTLEQAGVFRPCGNCNKREYERWRKE